MNNDFTFYPDDNTSVYFPGLTREYVETHGGTIKWTVICTDVIKNGSYIIYSTNAQNIVSESYNIPAIEEGTYIPKMVSRKKQMYPAIAEFLNN